MQRDAARPYMTGMMHPDIKGKAQEASKRKRHLAVPSRDRRRRSSLQLRDDEPETKDRR
jgi:hypothetical protein